MTRAQSWLDVDDDVRAWIMSIVDDLHEALGDVLVGVYLHGSIAMGCWHRDTSDVDLIVVVGRGLPADERTRVAASFVTASDRRPTNGDLEVSVITADVAKDFQHPSPYEVHSSERWLERHRAGAVDHTVRANDPDLAAHLTVIAAWGIAIDGPPIMETFGPVSATDYLDAIDRDLDDIARGEALLESPVYGVLNICRVLMVRAIGPNVVPNKEEGAAWALGALPAEHHSIVEHALDAYRGGAPLDPNDRRGELMALRDEAVRSSGRRPSSTRP